MIRHTTASPPARCAPRTTARAAFGSLVPVDAKGTGRTGSIRISPPRGFSLAEVLVAMAITSFALLALIGVLPEGLNSLQRAQRSEAEARIAQHLAARYRLKSWDELAQLVGRRDESSFDANGAWLESSSQDAVYRARAEVLSGLALPNETAASPFLRRLRVRITNQPGGGNALDTPSRYHERYLTLVDFDKTPDAAPPTDTTGTTGATGGSTGTTDGTTGTTANP